MDVTHRPPFRPAPALMMDSDMGVGRNWSFESLLSLSKVDVISCERSNKRLESTASGFRNS